MAYNFLSLKSPLEKLLEAEYFLAYQKNADGMEFQFELNAYLSAARSVTFYLQKNMAGVKNFDTWYQRHQILMKSDPAMKFFLELRNISQKQGPVSYVGGGLGRGWTYRFVSQLIQVPDELTGRDISECCAEHLAKLARLILDCYKTFPFESCPAKALTEEGMKALGYNIQDIEVALGFPLGYISQVDDVPTVEKLRLLHKEVDPLNAAELERLANGNFYSQGEPIKFYKASGKDLVDTIAKSISKGESPSKVTFIKAIMQRIEDIEKN